MHAMVSDITKKSLPHFPEANESTVEKLRKTKNGLYIFFPMQFFWKYINLSSNHHNKNIPIIYVYICVCVCVCVRLCVRLCV